MIAVIKTGSKQYKIQENSIIKTEKIHKKIGEIIEFDNILLKKDNDIQIEKSSLDNKKVLAEILSHGRDKKINIIKFRRRKHHIKKQGHRQSFTTIKIIKIEK